MFNKISLYFYTIISLKPSQVYFRILKKLGIRIPLGVSVSTNYSNVQTIQTPVELDFDRVFVERFPVEELMKNRITLLHSTKEVDWLGDWKFSDKSDLWNFNLHYFEFIFPLVKSYLDTDRKEYLNKTVEIIDGWITSNPIGKGVAWSSYTISLRIVNWLSYYSYVHSELNEDFKKRFLISLHCQYEYLSKHLEKDILGNHYFENLKSIILASLFFEDDRVFSHVLNLFLKECKEQILPDGMHFELSPMYHKIIFEGVLRVALALKCSNRRNHQLEQYLQAMLNVAYSFEDGLDRIPLFNDGGNNIAKSLESLVCASKKYFSILPQFCNKLDSSGYYFFAKIMDNHQWKLIVDAGQPGPKYIPGHAHCDAMSFELFRDGKPVIGNCGTYAYQSSERSFFRSTSSHNTIMLDGAEQSQCWSAFRLAKRASVKLLDLSDDSIEILLIDAYGKSCVRRFSFIDNVLEIVDKSEDCVIDSYVHCVAPTIRVQSEAQMQEFDHLYAYDYGLLERLKCMKYTGNSIVKYSIVLE